MQSVAKRAGELGAKDGDRGEVKKNGIGSFHKLIVKILSLGIGAAERGRERPPDFTKRSQPGYTLSTKPGENRGIL